jgi:hypothetical protein
MSAWIAVLLIPGSLALFIYGIWYSYQSRPKRLWLKYAQELSSTPEDPLINLVREIHSTVGAIGYDWLLGVPESNRGFHLYLDVGVNSKGLSLSIASPERLRNLPPLSIPWGQVASIGPQEGDWGRPGFAILVTGLPQEFDPNHPEKFLVWCECSSQVLEPVLQAYSSFSAA